METVFELDVSDQELTTLPSLQEGLRVLHCDSNQLVALPELPESLEELYCDENRLEELPPLPPNLKVLSCSDNFLKSLPHLSHLTSLTHLDCGYNQLTSLPELPPNLKVLRCRKNFLKYLPILPQSLEYLDISRHNFVEPYSTRIKPNIYTGEALERVKRIVLQIKAQDLAGLQGVYSQGRFAALPENNMSIIASYLTNMNQLQSIAERNLEIRTAAGQRPRAPLPVRAVNVVDPQVTCSGSGCFRWPRFLTRRRGTQVAPAPRRRRTTQRKSRKQKKSR